VSTISMARRAATRREMVPAATATRAQAVESRPGEPADAVVWEQSEQSAGEETRLSITYPCFMIIATMIAGIGAMLDQPILIVGAMVVGPEFGRSLHSVSAS
jgi:hypothetical protein